MKKKLKMAVIGGGSSYTPELIEGFINRYGEMPVEQVYLVDIEEGREKLEIVGALAKRMVEKAGVPIEVILTFDRREAIKDADFVITQLRVGLLEARGRDEHIPLRYNAIGQETTGAGGFAKAMRTIPVILDICKDIEELSPDAMLLNFTNPAGIITETVLKHTNVKSIGLCNLPIGIRMQMAKLCDTDLDNVFIEMIGINHLNWTTKIVVDGIDVTKEVLSKASEAKGLTMKNIPDFGWDKEFLQALGALPCSYHRYFYMKDEMLAEQLESVKTKGTRAEVVKRVEEELFELYKDPNLAIKPPQLQERGGAYYSEAALNLVSSIYNNKGDIQTVNVQNNGIIPCLPDDVSVEVNCVIDSQGAHPIQLSTEITPQIRGLLQVVKAYEELTVQAGVTGDYDTAVQALTINPLVGSVNLAKSILDDVLAENKKYLPQFN
ncbi:6-phospho-beta-glucosidase [Lederbergia citrea]|uniref:6-phospho-beta-glucosidase n=1 Tax=Lederbergia citrea TaxID=2833581 RepID=UPI001BC972F3|nr:6-phospho-beta-glucosidase [Lederbergia citrea]MBS4179014.1 6-phospho-beta-glucosidase [Lederbergia citrea]MBS4205673.1 6-phospho-beta-glucosidase [Lederbergia citrea]